MLPGHVERKDAMHILDRYLLNEFIRKFVGILLVLAFLLLLKEALRGLADVLAHTPPLVPVFLYFIFLLPQEMLFVIPTSVLLAMMFSVGTMAKNKEILAIHASGVSYWRIAWPLVLCIVAITFLAYVGLEVIAPYAQRKANYIEKVVIESKDVSVLTRNRNITTKGVGNRFYEMKNFDSGLMQMERPSIREHTDDGRTLSRRLEAESAQLVRRGEDGQWIPVRDAKKDQSYYWQFKNATYLQFNESGGLKSREFHERITLPMEENLDRFLADTDTEHMGLITLYKQSTVEGMRGKTDYYYKLKTQLHNRLAMPLATLLLGLLGYTFAVRSSIRSLTLEFGFALLTIVAYYIIVAFFEKLGETGTAPPIFSAWITNIAFLLFLALRFVHLEKVPKH